MKLFFSCKNLFAKPNFVLHLLTDGLYQPKHQAHWIYVQNGLFQEKIKREQTIQKQS